MQNVIKIALKLLFFLVQNHKIAQRLEAPPPGPRLRQAQVA